MEIRRVLNSFRFKLASILCWLLIFGATWLKKLSGGLESQSIVYSFGAYFLVLALTSPLISIYFLKTRYFNTRNLIKAHVIGSVLFGVFHFYLTGFIVLLLERLFQWHEHYTLRTLLQHFATNWLQIIDGMGWYVVYLMSLYIVHLYILYTNKKAQVNATRSDLVSSNLQVLSSQLNPHFLFNAMNNITMMVRRNDNKKAVSMIAALSDMLRAAMSKHNEQMTAFSNEADLLSKYLILEKERFKDRVDVQTSFSEEAMQASVPKMILQPIVENAFKHGVALNAGKSVIKIKGVVKNDRLILSVYNSGKESINWDINSSSSLGLPNTIHRLRQLYDSNFSFKVIEKTDGILFQISLPYLAI